MIHFRSLALMILVIVLLIVTRMQRRVIRDLQVELAKCDEIIEKYGGLEMALSKLAKKQLFALATSSAIGLSTLSGCQTDMQGRETRREVPVVYDLTESPSAPPSGYEAATASMLLEMNGIDVAEEDLEIRLLLASNADEFAEGLWHAIPLNKTIVASESTPLQFVPMPSIVWAFDRPMIFMYADEAEVRVVDPASDDNPTELTAYPWSIFQESYSNLGKQCVYITDRGYTPMT